MLVGEYGCPKFQWFIVIIPIKMVMVYSIFRHTQVIDESHVLMNPQCPHQTTT